MMEPLPEIVDWPLFWKIAHYEYSQTLVVCAKTDPMSAMDMAEARLRIGYLVKKNDPRRELCAVGLTIIGGVNNA